MQQRAQIIACARNYVGVRFRHQGRDRVTGLDCLGLLIVSARDAGIRLHGKCPTMLDVVDYGHLPDMHRLRSMLEQYLQPVAYPQVGDVVLLTVEGRAQHLALVSDYPQPQALGMIHAYAGARRVVEHRLDDAWRQQIVQSYQLP